MEALSEVLSRDSSLSPADVESADTNIQLSLSRNSVFNTIISGPDNEIMYQVSTPNHFFNSVTTITRLDKSSGERKFAGEIRWKPFDTLVRIGWQGEWMPVNQFLANGKSKISTARSFVGNYGIRYRWKTRGRILQMCQDDRDDASKKLPALVTYRDPDRHWFRVLKPARLLVSPTVLLSLDSIIVSFLIVEKRRRDD